MAFVREQFPAFAEPGLKDQAFFENAGGSYACQQVIDRLQSYYVKTKVQPYYPYPASSEAGEQMDTAYRRLAEYLGVTPDEVHIGPSTSQNTFVLARAFQNYLIDGEIVVTNQDHEANSGAWRRLAAEGVKVREWQVNHQTGRLSLTDLKPLLSGRTRLICFPHASNIIGEVNPVAEICVLAHAVGALTVVDGVSYAPHGLPNVNDLGADIYLFSAYKTYGPHQGVMVVRAAAMSALSNQSHYFNDSYGHKRLIPAGPDHAQVAALQGVTDYFDALALHHFPDELEDKSRTVHGLFRNAERELLAPLLEFLRAHPGIRIVGPDSAENRVPTVALLAEGHDPERLVRGLNERGMMCGSGHFYAARLLTALGISLDTGVLRLSLVHYTSVEDIERLMTALGELL